jgi:hypothetical protein
MGRRRQWLWQQGSQPRKDLRVLCWFTEYGRIMSLSRLVEVEPYAPSRIEIADQIVLHQSYNDLWIEQSHIRTNTGNNERSFHRLTGFIKPHGRR